MTYSHQRRAEQSQPKYLFSTLCEWFICVLRPPSAPVRRKRLTTIKRRSRFLSFLYLATDFSICLPKEPGDDRLALCANYTQLISSGSAAESSCLGTHPSSISLEFVYSPSGSSTRPERASERAAERKTTFARCKKFLIFPHSSRLSCAVYTRCIQISRISCIWSEVHFLFFPLLCRAIRVYCSFCSGARYSEAARTHKARWRVCKQRPNKSPGVIWQRTRLRTIGSWNVEWKRSTDHALRWK